MSCKLPPEIEKYLVQVESGKWKVCEEQKAMAALVRRAFEQDDIFVDTVQLGRYMSLEKYFPFALFPWERFLIAIWDCTYWSKDHEDKMLRGLPRWDTLFCMVGRGAGKDGLISFDSFCSVSPYSEVKENDVDICANLEEQAMRPVTDLYNILTVSKFAKKLKRFFYCTKERIKGLKNLGTIRGRTSNPKSGDGMRSGKIIFNECHQYQNYDLISVFKTGLGKKENPRTGYFTSNGRISDGPLDDLLARSERILFENEKDKGFFPFICRLKNKDQVHDPENWYMANPSLQYKRSLFIETQKEYEDWKERPEENGDFLSKRMGVRAGASELQVADYDKIKATNKPLPDLKNFACTAGIDYAEADDWMAANLHFRIGNQRYDINHAWVCNRSKTLHRVQFPWRDYIAKGDITEVDAETINPDLVAEWLMTNAKLYKIKGLALDHHRWTLVSNSLRKIGFDPENRKNVKLVRPSDIMQVEPVIQVCFKEELFNWGNTPHLRWAANNTKRVRASRTIGSETGNFYYAKIEAKSRKTDPFMALVASMTIEPLLGTGSAPISELPPVIVV